MFDPGIISKYTPNHLNFLQEFWIFVSKSIAKQLDHWILLLRLWKILDWPWNLWTWCSEVRPNNPVTQRVHMVHGVSRTPRNVDPRWSDLRADSQHLQRIAAAKVLEVCDGNSPWTPFHSAKCSKFQLLLHRCQMTHRVDINPNGGKVSHYRRENAQLRQLAAIIL